MTEVIVDINDTHTSRRFALWFTQYADGEFSLAFGKQRPIEGGAGDGWYSFGDWDTSRFGQPLEIVRAFRAAFQELEDRLGTPSSESIKPVSTSVRRSPAP